MKRLSRVLAAATLALSMAAGGCKTFDVGKAIPWADAKTPKPGQPAKIVAFWTETVMYRPGKPPTRGLGGRLYFYDATHDTIPVDGKLVVYGFDDAGPKPGDQPQRKYVFTSEQLARHYEESDLGPSYSVWIPWDAIGGEQKEISLLPMFVSADGAVLTGEQTRLLLSGKNARTPEQREKPALKRAPGAGVRPIGYEAPMESAPGADPRATRASWPVAQPDATNPPGDRTTMRTTTIAIPPTLRQRMAASRERTRITTIPRYGRSPRDTARWGPNYGPPSPIYPDPRMQTPPRNERPFTESSPAPPVDRPAYRPADSRTPRSAVDSPRSTRYAPARYQAPRGPGEWQSTGHGLSQPRPATWQSGSVPSRQPGQAYEAAGYEPSVSEAARQRPSAAPGA